MALVKCYAGEIGSNDVWQWEKTLEQERTVQQRRAIEHQKVRSR